MALPVSFRWDEELVARIDRVRGDVPRSVWVRRAVEQALSEAKEPKHPMRAGPGSVPSVEGVRPAAPAEQPKAVFRGPEAEAETLALLLGGPSSRRHLPGCKCPVCK